MSSPVLVNDLVEEVLLRIPPEKPAWLARSSAVCKPWRHILAAPRFRRRYREFHGTPPVLGLFEKKGRFIPTSSLILPAAEPDRTGWVTLDCRHGRALFSTSVRYGQPLDLIVLDPATGRQRSVPFSVQESLKFSAAVLCAAQGCDHLDCQEGHFLVALVITNELQGTASGWLYSSETLRWSELTYVLHHPNIEGCTSHSAQPSVLVGDTLYFNTDGIIECQVDTRRISMFEKPINGSKGRLMTAEDGGLGFAAVEDLSNLTLWSREIIGPEGSWAKTRVIDLKTLMSRVLKIPDKIMRSLTWKISGFGEGTQVIFVTTYFGSCMVDLKSGRARTLSCYENELFPYMSFYFPAMKAACTDPGQSAGV